MEATALHPHIQVRPERMGGIMRPMKNRDTSASDPDVRRMLVSHRHCGELMHEIPAVDESAPQANPDGPVVTYQCECGFAFEQRENQPGPKEQP